MSRRALSSRRLASSCASISSQIAGVIASAQRTNRVERRRGRHAACVIALIPKPFGSSE